MNDFLSAVFPRFLYTMMFTKVGLMENGETGSRLEMDGVRLFVEWKVMHAKQNPVWMNEGYGCKNSSFSSLLCKTWSSNADTGIYCLQLWLLEYLRVSDELFCFCQQK